MGDVNGTGTCACVPQVANMQKFLSQCLARAGEKKGTEV